MLFSAFKKLTDELYFKFFICIWRQKKPDASIARLL